MKHPLSTILLIAACLGLFPLAASAQFKEEAFTQNYNPSDTTSVKDSVDRMWSFKEFFRGVSHKDSLRIGSMFAGSTVFIGSEQIYNRQYWKLPLVYGGLGAGIGMGIHYRQKYKADETDTHSKDMSNYMFAAAGLVYWGTLMDGIVNYKRDVPGQPGKATVYSILLPGLGQAYNGEYWKIPIYCGGLVASFHYYSFNNTNYKRFKRIYNEATSDPEYSAMYTSDRAVYYRDVYRRYRDYSIVAIVGVYLLQVIDANVFAYMRDFEVTDEITMKVTPAVISPGNEFSFDSTRAQTPFYGGNALGLRLGLTF